MKRILCKRTAEKEDTKKPKLRINLDLYLPQTIIKILRHTRKGKIYMCYRQNRKQSTSLKYITIK